MALNPAELFLRDQEAGPDPPLTLITAVPALHVTADALDNQTRRTTRAQGEFFSLRGSNGGPEARDVVHDACVGCRRSAPREEQRINPAFARGTKGDPQAAASGTAGTPVRNWLAPGIERKGWAATAPLLSNNPVLWE
jgi:hypothetical protein